ncbi:MAG: TonB-dependent receptor [Hyphomonadaceae bacterium]|nr:TonB-dependent receptor [Hyphomonadaceae bacterium]
MNKDFFGRSAAVLSIAMALGASPALAQTTVDDVVITAQKVEQNQQDVPIAVTAFTAEQLRVNKIDSVLDVAQRTPGFVFNDVNPAEPNFYIRGIGTEGINSNAGGDASVVMFIDGVYMGRAGGSNLELFDLERVEVLRGPQGTLFGKNVVGGAISLISRRPDADPSWQFSGTVGNYDRAEGTVRVNHAINDTVFWNAAISGRSREGYTYNQTTGNHVDDEHSWGARTSLRFRPSDTLDVVLTADYSQQDQFGQVRDNVCDVTFQAGSHCVGVNPDPRISNAIIDGFLRREVAGFLADATWETSIGTFTSLTALRSADFDFQDPFFSNPVNPPAQIESINRNLEQSTQLSQEFRLAFNALDDRLTGVVGVYFLAEDVERDEQLDQRFPAPAQTGYGSFPQDVRSKSYAIFGQGTYAITDRLGLTLGARMTWEEKDAHLQGIRVQGPGFPPPLSAEFNVNASADWEAFTPRAALDWKVTDDVMLYVSAARGFKSGGFQGTAGTGASAAVPYNPEYAWSYEAGAKTELFDRRLRLNLAAFRTEHTDLQVSQLVPLCCVVIGNAAEAEINGVEVEWVLRPFAGLDINGSYAWLDAEFVDFATGATANFTGNTLPRSPENKYNLGVQYRFDLADAGSIVMRADYTYQTEIFLEASNTPLEVQPDYDMIDARVAYESAGGRWELAAWGKNLTDELVLTHSTAFAPFQQRLNIYQPPETYGLTLTVRN